MSLRISQSHARPAPPRPEKTGWRSRFNVGGLLTLGLGAVISLLVTDLVLEPTKRGFEVLAGLIFLGLVIVAHPLNALLFTIFVVPFPAHTSVGSTSTLLIFALGGLTMVKSKALNLRSPFVNKGADLAIMGFLLMMFLSLSQQDFSEPGPIREFILGMLSAVILYYVIIQLATSLEAFERVLMTSQAVGFVLAVIANLQALFPTKTILPAFFKFSREVAEMEEVRAGQVRVFATFNGYEMFAEYCAMNIFLQYILFRQSRSMLAKSFWLFSMALTLMALFRTGTRGGLIILLFGLIYLIAVGDKAIGRGPLLKTVFVAMMMFYLAVPFIHNEIGFLLERMQTIGTEDSSVQSREGVLTQALAGIPDSPYVGHGPYQPPGWFRGGVTQHIHNMYVTLMYKMGIPSLVAFLWLATILFRKSFHLARAPGVDPRGRIFMLVLHVTFAMWLLDQVKIEFTRAPINMHVAWAHMGMIMALTRVLEELQPGERRRA